MAMNWNPFGQQQQANPLQQGRQRRKRQPWELPETPGGMGQADGSGSRRV